MMAKHRHHGELVSLPPWLWTTVITAVVYAASSLRRLPGGDSAELMAEACIGGVAHPPGYPLLLSLLRLAHSTAQYFALLHSRLTRCRLHGCEDDADVVVPMALVANVMNVSFAVGAAACVAHVVDQWSRREAPVEAVAAGLMFATSKLTWEYAIGLEVCLAAMVRVSRLVRSEAGAGAENEEHSGIRRCLRSTIFSLGFSTCSCFVTFNNRVRIMRSLARSCAAWGSRTSTQSVAIARSIRSSCWV